MHSLALGLLVAALWQERSALTFAYFVIWTPPSGGDQALGLVEFAKFPHLDYEKLPDTTLANAEKWATTIEDRVVQKARRVGAQRSVRSGLSGLLPRVSPKPQPAHSAASRPAGDYAALAAVRC
jgi:hypothetical protein